MNRKKDSVISKNALIKGELFLKYSLYIEGTFEGSIQTLESVYIFKSSKVKSNIKAKTVIVEGNLIGDIIASKSVDIKSTGSVKGDISSPNLKIEDGAITYGKVSINEPNYKGS